MLQQAPEAVFTDDRDGWWANRVLIIVLVLLSAAPLLYPKVPPLVDLLGHMGRYRVQLDLTHSPSLQRFYGFHWAPIGNLGVDLLIMPIGQLFGLETGVKLIALTIAPLTCAGFLWVAREVHGRIPPTAFFALPFALGFPFLFGFVNFALSIALAFLAFGLWLQLARREKTRLRAVLFVPISVIVFFAHAYGWGVLGLLCFSAEAVRQHDRGAGWIRSAWNAALAASVMALPILFMLVWRSEAHGGRTGGWFEWQWKWQWIYSALRDRWRYFDLGSLVAVAAVFLFALVSRAFTFSRHLAFSALVLAVCFVLLPRIIFGSAYADMRLAPYVFAVALLAIRSRTAVYPRSATALAVLGIAFFLARVGATTASLAIAANDQQQKLRALDYIPQGARVVNFVGEPCRGYWPMLRDSHLGAMVIVRKQGFSNDQWVLEGMNLLTLKNFGAGPFAADPSEIVRPAHCPEGYYYWSANRALASIPRGAFDYVWIIDPPPFDSSLLAGLEPVASGRQWLLFRIPSPKHGD